jgi:hypothetical protein
MTFEVLDLVVLFLYGFAGAAAGAAGSVFS